MRLCLFGYEGHELREAAASGLRRLGHEILPQVPSCWSPEQAIRNVDGAVVCGNRSNNGAAARYYASRGKRVVMIDYPHLAREAGDQYRVTPPDHAWLPDIADPDPKRFEALGIKVLPAKKAVKAQSVLVLGQRSGDPTHGLSGSEFRAWATAIMAQVRGLCEWKVTWRPHPGDVYKLDGFDDYSDPLTEPLEAAFEHTRLVITHSSNGGLKALINGLPVIVDGEPIYKALCFRINEFSRAKAPEHDDLLRFLHLLAHTQWSAEEIATGDPFRQLLPDQLGT